MGQILDNNFLHLLVEFAEFQQILWRLANQTAQPGIYLDQIARIMVHLPSVEEQTKIAEKVRGVDLRIDHEIAEGQKLMSLRAGLRDDLLTGRKPVMPIREAAE